MSRRLTFEFLLAVTVAVTEARAQPASINSNPQPIRAAVVFHSSGDQYYFGTAGPVTAGAVQTENGGGTCLHSNGFFDFPGPCYDAYVARMDSSGNLIFGTFLGGPTDDQPAALATDTAGNVYVAGSTAGSFPVTAHAAGTAGSVFAAKLSADGTRLLYSTYLPESAATAAGIAVDEQGNTFVAGTSRTGHAYVVKVSSDGSSFLYNISLAGSNQDSALAMSADAAGNVIVTGQTDSPDFPATPGAVQPGLKGAKNVFVAKLDPRGSVLFSTYLGGSGTDAPAAVQSDSAGNVYVAGQTNSLDFPTTARSFEPTPVFPLWNNGGPGGFVAKISANGSTLEWSTYVMSVDSAPPIISQTPIVDPGQAGVTQLAVSDSGDTFIAGLTGAGFPVTVSAPQACFEGVDANVSFLHANAFVARLDRRGALLDATYAGRNVAFTSALTLGRDGSILLGADGFTHRLRFGGAGWSAPSCLSTSVLNSATFSGGFAVVPGELITLTGIGLGPDAGIAYEPDSKGQIPRQLGGVQVLFDGEPAPVLYAQSRQINAMAPVELKSRSKTTIQVQYQRAMIGEVDAAVVPNGIQGIFRLQPGVSSQAAALNEDGTPNSPSNPAARGSVITVWGTGFGLIDPSCATGGLNPPGPVALAPGLGVWIAHTKGPVQLPEYTRAEYAGSAPGLPCGVTQINLRIPTDIPAGGYPFLPWSGMDREGGAFSVVPAITEATISVK